MMVLTSHSLPKVKRAYVKWTDEDLQDAAVRTSDLIAELLDFPERDLGINIDPASV